MTTHTRTFEHILRLLRDCDTTAPPFPPTELFNETWMLRLVLDALQRYGAAAQGLTFAPDSRWYSEALLRSPFLARRKPDALSEGFTHADAVIGHLAFQPHTRAGLTLDAGATQFVVVEAKMFSNLATRTQNARSWSQASRNLACMALALQAAGRPLSDYASLAFWVLAPDGLRRGPGTNLEECLRPSTIAREVRERIAAYGADGDARKHEELLRWEEAWLDPLLRHLTGTGCLGVLTWDRCIEAIAAKDAEAGADLAAFYARCLAFSPHAAAA